MHSIPYLAATMTSGTVDIPTASAPQARIIRISAEDSYDGPFVQQYTPSLNGILFSNAIDFALASNSRLNSGLARPYFIRDVAVERVLE